eukprot:GILK01001437.1.p1 GENE.GILK01001437.1~~GILK01001437.1.p1  ORF type:complete len:494 (-),score=53.72 GILK01001437.1:165-1598(-)
MTSRFVVVFVLLCACACVAVVDANCKQHEEEDVCTDNGCCWDESEGCADCPLEDDVEPELEPSDLSKTCSDDDASKIVTKLKVLFETLDYAKQKGNKFPYHGRKHGEVFAESLDSILGYLEAEDKVSANIKKSLLLIAAWYHDSGYSRPGALTRPWISSQNPETGKYENAVLGRGHERESALQLLEHLDRVRESEPELAQSGCFQPEYLFQMVMLIQSTSVGEAIFGASGQAKKVDLTREMGEVGFDEKKRREELHVGFVAVQACNVWNLWVKSTQDSGIRTEAEKSFCADVRPENLPIDYEDAYVAFTLARSDFGQVHQFGGLCWARNLLMEMFQRCRGLSCVLSSFNDEQAPRGESVQEKAGRLTKVFFKDHVGFLTLGWVRWPEAWLDQPFKQHTRRYYYELNQKQTAALVHCLENRRNIRSRDRYIRKILTSVTEREKLCPALAALGGSGPLCKMDVVYNALMPAAYDPAQLP